jgi:hypothetical protein
MKQKLPRYEMHKYWGKKPPQDLARLIEQYTMPSDLVLDPFAGYGVFACEAVIQQRRAISHDLNPVASFIQNQLLNQDIDLKVFQTTLQEILQELEQETANLYQTTCPKCLQLAPITATLRNKQDELLIHKISCACSKAAIEKPAETADIEQLKTQEANLVIPEHPNQPLIRNGRISAKEGMTTDDLFTPRALYVHSVLWNKLQAIQIPAIKALGLFTFTSNLANCSRLVPPIKSRGAMSAGAWMTGFYTGETYIENNVVHYFKNRFKKVLNGKKDYFAHLPQAITHHQDLTHLYAAQHGYMVMNGDAKSLKISDQSIDYIFTDFPYGDSVPYFEQSILWNTWLNFAVDYQDEIVVSDSNQRQKNQHHFAQDIRQAVEEIYRVLKFDKYFSFTFHSLEGNEWYALITSCLECGFVIENIEEMTQKTLPPRQLNRAVTIKGDMLVTFKKVTNTTQPRYLSLEETLAVFDQVVDANQSFAENYSLLIQHFFGQSMIFAEVNITQEILTRLQPQ